ncbi:class I SAM-dependent methyltransferase [Gellertiella hungarica]|uniref:SAM-dependent methyltransferase n=1 Tax=Gellertiella hungarica TaxID=1572859 RepID=A0A7W6J3A7_9HYPH|nr:class I SAM-dependent methyltransferase [Gellertiella hungarica]MBB4063943.1 SAM-dependent methyltransferase [Gellertiella hungarica]
MTNCPACDGTEHNVILTRSNVPVLQNVIVKTEEEARAFPVARLRICQCRNCDFVWNADFDADVIRYDSSYNNSVQASGVYRAHQSAMAEKILARPGTFNCVDIGCGEGEFLEELARSGRVGKAIGFDPAFKGHPGMHPAVSVRTHYFTEETARALPDDIHVVCSRHTIEHIPEPAPFIEAIAGYVRARNLPLYLETPDVDWILRNKAFEDFFYEHCSLFSPRSMTLLLKRYGLDCRVEAVYGGQYMWVEAWPAEEVKDVLPPAPADIPAHDGISEVLAYWENRLSDLRRDGPVAIWGGASKGVTFSLLVPGVDMAIDLNPAKQGCYMPVSATPILPPEEALARGVRSIVVMNPNYHAEIEARLNQLGWSGTLLGLQDRAA